ncbi:MAG: hypothetical protein N2491_08575 [Negativicutes bacterium]|nr:hypothetical protein [Negativicutes bacterium]
MLILPVANNVLPRPAGGRIRGMFLMEQGGSLLTQAGKGCDILICPWVVDEAALYPVGVVSRVVELEQQTLHDHEAGEVTVLLAVLEGRGHARWHSLKNAGNLLFSTDVEFLNFYQMRKEYPVISGAGWQPAGGFTEFRHSADIPVTIYGTDLATGRQVSISANLGGLVEQEQAHTIEHAVIRALRTYGLCTVRTLIDALGKETSELKQSIEKSFRFTMPEFLGTTATGACGNEMTNLAQFYLAKGFLDNLQEGRSWQEALISARRMTMSQLAGDLGLTTQEGIRVLQGLKKGMSHDDTPLKTELLKKVLSRFPFEPWE